MQLFVTDLHDFNLSGYDNLIEDLKDILLEQEQNSTNTESYSLKGKTGWHSPDNLCAGDDELSTHLRSILYTATKEYAESIGYFLPPIEFCNIKCWAMIMRSGDYSTTHSHPGCKFSGVLYLKVPDNMPDNEGNLVFIDPRPGARSSLVWGSLIHREKPERGKGFVFPNWLEHYVECHYTDDVRISLAWNFDY